MSALGDHQSQVELFESHNAALDGTTDDSTALQQIFDSYYGTTRGALCFPPGKRIRLDSGLTLRSGEVAVDFNGCILDFANLSSGYALSILQETASPYGYAYAAPIQNFNLLGPASEASNADGLFIGRLSGNGRVTGQTLANFLVRGFRDDLYIGDYAYVNTIVNGNLERAWRYGLNYQAATNSGEDINWHGGRIADCVNTGGTAIGALLASPDNGNNELHLHGVSLDYCDVLADIQGGALNAHGCHFESNHVTNPMVSITSNSGDVPSGLYAFGGTFAPTEAAASSRPSLITLSGGKAFCVARSKFEMYDRSSEIVTVSGSPRVDITGSQVDFAGVDRFPRIGAALSLMVNGGFELGTLAGWTFSGTSYTFTADTSVKRTGSWSGKMVSVGTSNGGLRQSVPCRPGQQVFFRSWVNVPTLTAGQVTLRVIFYSDADAVLVQNNDVTTFTVATSGWQEVRGVRVVPPGTHHVQLQMYGLGFTGTAYLDDCEVHVL